MYPDTSQATLASLLSLELYGIPRSEAIAELHNTFSIPLDLQGIFSSYFLLKWEATYFTALLHEGTIERDGVTYQVIYKDTGAARITRQAEAGKNLLLSFRELQEEYKAMPTVLVRITSK